MPDPRTAVATRATGRDGTPAGRRLRATVGCVRIGIVGSGRIGGTLARLLVLAGHDVAISNSRGADSLRELASTLGDRAYAASVDDAAAFGELVLIAIPLRGVREIRPGPFEGKVTIDANNYFPGRDGSFPELDRDETTSSELVASRLRTARVVKAFNTVHSETLANEGRPDAPSEERVVVALAGDEERAKKQVAGLVEQIGFAALDTGSLAEGGRLQQPGAPFFNRRLRLPEARRDLASLRG
jgi:predicted dinucleotide-binding enzyme